MAIRPLVQSGAVSPLLLADPVSPPGPSPVPFEGPGTISDTTAAAQRWAFLLRLYPESTRELLFRLPWYTTACLSSVSSLDPPYTSEGRPASWTFKVICKSVPLDMTWGEVASALNASTPVIMGNSYFTASSRILSPFKTIRESNVAPFSTIVTNERILGGSDRGDSDSSSEEDPDSSVPVTLSTDPGSSTVARFMAAISSPFRDAEPSSTARVEFSPAVESPLEAPTDPLVPTVVEQGGENADDGTLSPPRARSGSPFHESDLSDDSDSSLGRIIQDSRRGLLADDDVQAHHLTEGADDMPVEPERVVATNAPPPSTYILWDQFVADGSVPPAFAASGLNISDAEFRIMFPEGGMPTPNSVRPGEPMYYPGQALHQHEEELASRVQRHWKKAQDDEVRVIEQGIESGGWFMGLILLLNLR